MNRLGGKSIQFRLTAWFTALFAFTFLLMGLGVWLALNQSINQTADKELHSRLANIRKYFDSFTPDDLAHLEEEFREEALLSQASANVRISDAHGRWLFRTQAAERWPEETLNVKDLPAYGETKTVRAGKQLVRLLTAPVRVGAVQIGLPIDEFEEVKSGFLWLVALGSPLALLLAWFGGSWMSGRALKPVDRISGTAAKIGAQDLSARLPTNGTGDELDRLSGVLNGMLDRLESSFRRITEFTAEASHELRTPVAIIHTTAELMQSRPRTLEEHSTAWARVKTETEATSRLIADLLTLARADAGKMELELRTIDLATTVALASEEMRVLADLKGVRLEVSGTTSPCFIQGDAEALRRLIRILLDNAIKFTLSGGSIRVSVRSNQRAQVAIADTGVGMSQEDLPLIFERFYRASKDRSRQTGGSGLGLSIGRWIVEQHGGEMQVKSSASTGSEFTLLLPLCSSGGESRFGNG